MLGLGIGFIIGRHIYIRQDMKQAYKNEAQIKQRIAVTLEELGLSKKEINSRFTNIFQ